MYRKIDPRVWNDEKFRSLSERCKFFFLYLLTSPHSSNCGAYILDDLYIQADLGFTLKQVAEAWEEIVKLGFVMRDSETRLVALPNWFKYNLPANEKSAKACINALQNLPPSKALTQYCQGSEWVREQLANGSLTVRTILENGSPVSVTDTDTVTDPVPPLIPPKSQPPSKPERVPRPAPQPPSELAVKFATTFIGRWTIWNPRVKYKPGTESVLAQALLDRYGETELNRVLAFVWAHNEPGFKWRDFVLSLAVLFEKPRGDSPHAVYDNYFECLQDKAKKDRELKAERKCQ